jgi:hypothetical protein
MRLEEAIGATFKKIDTCGPSKKDYEGFTPGQLSFA